MLKVISRAPILIKDNQNIADGYSMVFF